MRSVRKAVLEDIGSLSDCDSEFGFGGRKEFVESAIRRGGAYVLAQAGFQPSGTIDNLDPNDPEVVYYKAVKSGGSGIGS